LKVVMHPLGKQFSGSCASLARMPSLTRLRRLGYGGLRGVWTRGRRFCLPCLRRTTFLRAFQLITSNLDEDSKGPGLRLLTTALATGARLPCMTSGEERVELARDLCRMFFQSRASASRLHEARGESTLQSRDKALAAALEAVRTLVDVRNGTLSAVMSAVIQEHHKAGIKLVPGQATRTALLRMCSRCEGPGGPLAFSSSSRLKQAGYDIEDLMMQQERDSLVAKPARYGPKHEMEVRIRKLRAHKQISEQICKAIVDAGLDDIFTTLVGGNDTAIEEFINYKHNQDC